MLIVVAAVLVAVWELGHAFATGEIRLTREPVMAGGAVMVLAAYFFGAPALVTATARHRAGQHAVAAARRGDGLRHGRHRRRCSRSSTCRSSAGSSRCCCSEEDGALAIVTFILVTIASDIGGYAVGVVAGKHPMAPVISPKKSWEGFAGSAVSCVVVGWLTVVHLLTGTGGSASRSG